MLLSGISLPSVISAFAPIRQLRPIFAPFSTTALMPIRLLSPIVQPCSITLWPIVTWLPITSGRARVGVQHRAVLNVRVFADRDQLVVAADRPR